MLCKAGTEAERVVPQCVELHDKSCAGHHGASVGRGVHPCGGSFRSVGLHESIVGHEQVGVFAVSDIGEDVPDELSVFLGAAFLAFLFGVLLYAPDGPQWHVGLVELIEFDGERLFLHEFSQSFLSCFHGGFEELCLLDTQRQSGQGNEGVACAGLEPRVSGNDIFLAVFVLDMELVCGVDQTVEEIIAWRALVGLFLEERSECAHFVFRGRGGKDDAFSFADGHFEVSGNVEVLIAGISSLLLFGIFDAAVPVGLEDELHFTGELHVEIGIARIHAGLYAVFDLGIVSAGHTVLVCELSDASEGEEGPELQCSGRVCVIESVADEQSVFIMLKDNFFSEYHTTNAIGGGRHLVAIKRLDILVAHGAVVVALILVQTEVESRSMLDDTAIERREQHMVFVIEFRHGDNEQSVVFACIAVYYRRA